MDEGPEAFRRWVAIHETDLRTGPVEKNDLARGPVGDVEKGGIFRWASVSPYAFSKGAQERYMGAKR